MISKLAKSDIELMWSDGLKPTVEDIIRLNALGLKVESGSEAYDFSALPRVAFLGDYILTEPSVYKRYWLDSAVKLLPDDYITKLFLYTYALNIADDDLPKLTNTNNIKCPLLEFSEGISHFTEAQLLTAIDYVMNGNDHTRDEDYELKKDFDDVYNIPSEIKSVSQQLIAEVLSNGVSNDAIHMTQPVLERLLTVAIMKNGVDALKNEHVKFVGKYYACLGNIKTRLKEEIKNGKE